MEEEKNNINVGLGEGGDSNNLIFGVIVILAIIILGGLYFWNQRISKDAAIDEINTQNNADEAATIEADLNATDIENLDAELNAS